MTGSVLIIGATSGIGRAVAHRAARAGANVILAGRDLEELERQAADLRIRYSVEAKATAFDALEFAEHRAFMERCGSMFADGMAGVVVCHGYLTPQAEAQEDFCKARRMIDTNFTSVVSICELAANAFENRPSGFIAVISSVAGDRGRQSNYLYGASKGGLNVYVQGLRNRLAKAGVAVITIKPGFVDTAMTYGLPGMFLVATPERVARDIWRAIERRRSVVYTPWFWRWIMLIIRSIPEFVFKRMKI